MAMISPSSDAFSDSHQTLKFANRAKNIKNEAYINEDTDQRALLRKYQTELKKLKQELFERNQTIGGAGYNQNEIMQLEQERKRAEEDKNAAITALETRSKEFYAAQAQKQ